MDIKALGKDRVYSMKTYQKETSWGLYVVRDLGQRLTIGMPKRLNSSMPGTDH